MSAARGAALALACAALAAEASDIEFSAFDREGKPLSNVAVFAVPATGAPPAGEARNEVVGQKGWEFAPYLTVVRVGSKVEFPNLDRTTHHVKSFSPAKEFEFFLAADKAAAPAVLFDKPGAIVVYCTLHDWMRAYVYVVDTPWFTKSAEAGIGKISGVPNGTYKVTAWHPDLGSVGTPLTQSVTLKDGGAKLKFDFAFTPRKPRTPKVLPQA